MPAYVSDRALWTWAAEASNFNTSEPASVKVPSKTLPSMTVLTRQAASEASNVASPRHDMVKMSPTGSRIVVVQVRPSSRSEVSTWTKTSCSAGSLSSSRRSLITPRAESSAALRSLPPKSAKVTFTNDRALSRPVLNSSKTPYTSVANNTTHSSVVAYMVLGTGDCAKEWPSKNTSKRYPNCANAPMACRTTRAESTFAMPSRAASTCDSEASQCTQSDFSWNRSNPGSVSSAKTMRNWPCAIRALAPTIMSATGVDVPRPRRA
mmetsp:Transcript_11791/g.39367  ORF Transcript_11791/g.39367 Transcript_11791/m.39367 type:complete len:265 (+) Transcript_11791:5418-6212(+)